MLMRGAITERYVNPYDFPPGMILGKRLCKNELSENHTSQPHQLTVPLPPFWTVNFKHSKCKAACWDNSKKSLAMNCNYLPPPQFQAKNKLDNECSLSELNSHVGDVEFCSKTSCGLHSLRQIKKFFFFFFSEESAKKDYAGGRERLYCFPLFAHYRLITTSVTSHSNEAKLRLAWLV